MKLIRILILPCIWIKDCIHFATNIDEEKMIKLTDINFKEIIMNYIGTLFIIVLFLSIFLLIGIIAKGVF